MAKDIIIDYKERDVLFKDVTDNKTVVYDTQWGKVFIEDTDNDVLNILVPIQYRRKIKFVNDELIVKVNISYYPAMKPFKVRFLSYIGDELVQLDRDNEPQGEFSISCISDDNNVPEIPNASQLPLINIDGYFTLKLTKDSDKAYIYSGKETDLDIDFSDNQSARILMLCAPGKLYRYPVTGISIYDYLNGVIAHSDIAKKINEEFGAEDRNVIEAYFDSNTGQMDLTTTPELTEEDEGLDDVMELNLNDVAEITGNDFSEITGTTSSGSTGSGGTGTGSGGTGNKPLPGTSSLIYDSIELLTAISLIDKEYQTMVNEEKTRISNELSRIQSEQNREKAEALRVEAEEKRKQYVDSVFEEGTQIVSQIKELRDFMDTQLPHYVYEDEWKRMSDEDKGNKLWYILKGNKPTEDDATSINAIYQDGKLIIENVSASDGKITLPGVFDNGKLLLDFRKTDDTVRSVLLTEDIEGVENGTQILEGVVHNGAVTIEL